MLCSKDTLFVTLETKILDFDHIKELYQNDDDFFKSIPKDLTKDFS